ncbi:hypothetical protein L6164_002642 [Bauhinia variegata]|uniref:Uncharacterized protein n=1 Tax=Bauhinia variegata TaxID=167791 RepID=A0ACB9PYU7_BAUVA|nr:hypothetical protein L6164_002642 [Bauhinia variegata]
MAKSYCCVFLFSSLSFLVTLFGFGATPILLGGKTLKIGIPIKTDFKEFVDVKLNSTNQAKQNQVSWYSIDVFFAAVSYLEGQYSGLKFSYEFEAFVNKEGMFNGTYEELLQRISEKYDAVVGDVTIVANRSTYVDFTLPYFESGVKMLIQVRHRRHLDMWNFLQPFNWDLWLSIFVFCVFIGLVLLFMERNANKEAGMKDSPSRKQPGTTSSILWLPIARTVLPESALVSPKGITRNSKGRCPFKWGRMSQSHLRHSLCASTHAIGNSNPRDGGLETRKVKFPEPRTFNGARDAKELENFLFDMER